ncbi:MAG: hypothetical protein JNK89_08310 [Saprospiraceae bacterium]|nr:hypothetical protein [Saprospiraceae bacterium]
MQSNNKGFASAKIAGLEGNFVLEMAGTSPNARLPFVFLILPGFAVTDSPASRNAFGLVFFSGFAHPD